MAEEIREKWTIDEVIFAVQVVLFWTTCVAGVFMLAFTAIKKINFPIFWEIIAFLTIVAIQIPFIVAIAKTPEDTDEEEVSQKLKRKYELHKHRI